MCLTKAQHMVQHEQWHELMSRGVGHSLIGKDLELAA